jgi:hypothetical protein
LTEQELLLDLALKAVIEALGMNPDRYAIIYNSRYDNNDNVLNNNTNTGGSYLFFLLLFFLSLP